MSFTTSTPNYGLPKYTNSNNDVPSWITDISGMSTTIDTQLKENADGVASASADASAAKESADKAIQDIGAANTAIVSLTESVNTLKTDTADLPAIRDNIKSNSDNIVKNTSDIDTITTTVTNMSNDVFSVYTATFSGGQINLSGAGKYITFIAPTSSDNITTWSVNNSVFTVKDSNGNPPQFSNGAVLFAIIDGTTLNFNSGGAALNVSVIGGTTRPVNPTNNTIWVNTPIPVSIKKTYFQATQPSDTSLGALWILTAGSSKTPFSYLSGYNFMCYPTNSFIYNGTTWEAVSAQTYYNNAWVIWVNIFLQGADKFTDITGGYDYTKSGSAGSVNINSPNGFVIDCHGDNVEAAGHAPTISITSNNAVNLMGINTLRFTWSNINVPSGAGTGSVGISSTKNGNMTKSTSIMVAGTYSNKIYDVDVTDVSSAFIRVNGSVSSNYTSHGFDGTLYKIEGI